MITVRITKIDPRATIPEYKTPGAAAFDLCVIESATIPARSAVRLRTGFVFGLPQEHVLFLFARSSLFGKHGLMLANSVGVIDPDYCGAEDELLISVWNPGDADVHIDEGTRLCQGIILPRPQIRFEEGPIHTSSRGGFGSTG